MSPAEPPANPGSAVGERATAAPEPGAGRGGGGSSEAGTSTGAGGAGGGGGTAVASGGPAGGAPGAEYGGYLAQMRRRLMEAVQYPQPARSRGLSGTVTLDIFIGPNGAIGNVSVTRSSSHPLLDEAALEAARSLAPQPFPKGLAPRPLRVRLPVVFDLQ
jgi:periplasmic protein TonB